MALLVSRLGRGSGSSGTIDTRELEAALGHVRERSTRSTPRFR
jgi:hypothetical protein